MEVAVGARWRAVAALVLVELVGAVRLPVDDRARLLLRTHGVQVVAAKGGAVLVAHREHRAEGRLDARLLPNLP